MYNNLKFPKLNNPKFSNFVLVCGLNLLRIKASLYYLPVIAILVLALEHLYEL